MFDDLHIRTYVDDKNDYYINIEDLYNHLMISVERMRNDEQFGPLKLSPRAYERMLGMIGGIESVALLIAVGGLGMDMNIKINDIGDLFNDL